jgi:hypothetical protein
MITILGRVYLEGQNAHAHVLAMLIGEEILTSSLPYLRLWTHAAFCMWD